MDGSDNPMQISNFGLRFDETVFKEDAGTAVLYSRNSMSDLFLVNSQNIAIGLFTVNVAVQ